MDPDVTFNRFMDAIEANDIDEAKMAYADLERWIVFGGYIPKIDATIFLKLLKLASSACQS